jgi:hypothetical protein
VGVRAFERKGGVTMRCLTVDNWLLMAQFVVLLGGGVFAWVQWRKSNKIRRAEFIREIIDTLRFNKDMADTMYMVKYRQGWYNSDFHDNPDGIEFDVDKLLSHFEYICYLRKTKNIEDVEFNLLRFDVDTACQSLDVQAHLLEFVRDVSVSIETTNPYKYLIDYGIERGFIKA